MFQGHSAKFTTLDILRFILPIFRILANIYVRHIILLYIKLYSEPIPCPIQTYLAPSAYFLSFTHIIQVLFKHYLGKFRHRNLAYLGRYSFTHIQVYQHATYASTPLTPPTLTRYSGKSATRTTHAIRASMPASHYIVCCRINKMRFDSILLVAAKRFEMKTGLLRMLQQTEQIICTHFFKKFFNLQDFTLIVSFPSVLYPIVNTLVFVNSAIYRFIASFSPLSGLNHEYIFARKVVPILRKF